MRTSPFVLAVLLSTALPGQDQAAAEPVEYSFGTAPLNARGARSLADLRGAPTIIEFWGVR